MLLLARERLTEIHEQYEERELRWNRIASLLNRDDLSNFISPAPVNPPVVYRGRDSPRLRT